ncbi:hypothetical protein [Dyadobacter soli]|nr:hypothetical protein [Dyadobacter soli]
MAALLLFTSFTKQKPAALFLYIASAAFGPKAFRGGRRMVIWGIGFHFLIALIWTALYFQIFTPVLPDQTPIVLNAVSYGIIIWLVMNLVILPLSKAERRPFSLPLAIINMLILIIAIGIPCAYVARHFVE